MPSVVLSNGQVDFFEVDDFTDPWKSDSTDIVVFQPGILRHTEFVYHLVPLMSRDVKFIRRDLRGHGKSSGGDAEGYPYTLDTLIDEMGDFIDRVAGCPVHWIGESTAGMLAIALAKKYPNKLKSLILMSTPVVLGPDFQRMVSEPFSSQAEAMRKLGLVEWQKSRPVSRLGTDQATETNEMGRFCGSGYLRWYDEMLQKHDLEGVAKYCEFVADVDVSGLVKEIAVPTLIVAPQRSMASPLSLNESMARQIKDSRLVVIPGVGHMVYIDEPEKSCSAILDWIKDLGARGVHHG